MTSSRQKQPRLVVWSWQKTAGACQLVGGQADDLKAETESPNAEKLHAIHRRKTGAMFVSSVRLGGLVAEASHQQMEALTTYGRNIGLAFQIVDDLLDHQGQAQQLGKRTQKDADRGKLTFPTLYGAADSQQKAVALIDAACAALVPFDKQADELQNLAKFVIERTY